jgi:glycosyltransferase involved in cell wall biosynthesis
MGCLASGFGAVGGEIPYVESLLPNHRTLPSMKTVHIVIPCYNEEDRLPGDELLSFVEANPWASVSLINDGSTDRTQELIERLAAEIPSRIEAHGMPQNAGKAQAVRQGALHSLRRTFDFVAYLDADFSTLPIALAEMIEAAEPQHQMILGSRVLRAGAVIKRSARRHYLGRVFATAASLGLNLPFYDTQCGAKLIERRLVEPLFTEPFMSRWLFDLELLMRFRQLVGEEDFKRSVIEVPLRRWVDQGSSRIRLRDLVAVPYGLLRIRHRYRPQGRGNRRDARQ